MPGLTAALNGYPRMINASLRHMTPKQRRYFEHLILGLSHEAIAKQYGVEQSTISRTLKRAGADQLDAMREGLSALLRFVADHIGWGAGEGAGT